MVVGLPGEPISLVVQHGIHAFLQFCGTATSDDAVLDQPLEFVRTEAKQPAENFFVVLARQRCRAGIAGLRPR
jgi:hypothetical protein